MRALSPALVGRLKPVLFVLLALPMLGLGWRIWSGRLGPEPVETLLFTNGDWALRCLLLTLAVTPLRELTGWRALIRVRRMIGLFAFAYAVLHFTVYFLFDQNLSPALVAADVVERPFILLGASALLLLVPLAATSTDAMMRRLGGRRWQRLHRLVYPAAIAAVVHYLWLVRSDWREPALYAVILFVLLALRLPPLRGRRRLAGATRPTATG